VAELHLLLPLLVTHWTTCEYRSTREE